MLEVSSKDLSKLVRRLDRLGKAGAVAQSRALKDTNRRIQPFLNRSVRSEYVLKVAQVKAAINVSPVRRESFRVSVSGKPLGLHEFGRFSQVGKPGRSKRSRKRGGVKARVRKAERQRLYKGAFIGGRGTPRPGAKKRLPGHIFRRESKKRLPIGKMFGPTVSQMVAESDRLKDIESFALQTLRKNLERRLSRFR